MTTDRGFTLLEVLIAFVIAALALVALTQGVAGGLQSSQVAAHTQQAVSRARSHLAALMIPVPGDTSGDDGGGYRWRQVVTADAVAAPARPGLGTSSGSPPLRARRPILYGVTVTISWQLDGGERSVALATQRLAEAPADGP